MDLQYLKFPPAMSFIGLLMVFVAAFYILNLFQVGYFTKIPANFIMLIKKYKYHLISLLLLIVFEVTILDFSVSRFCKVNFNQNLYSILDFINSMGEGWFLGGVLFTGILVADFYRHQYFSELFRISFTSLISAGILNTFLKVLFNRQRPSIALEPYDFFHFVNTGATDFKQLIYASNSMPSGHTIAVFAVITPFLLSLKNTWVCSLLSAFGLLIYLSSVYVKSLVE